MHPCHKPWLPQAVQLAWVSAIFKSDFDLRFMWVTWPKSVDVTALGDKRGAARDEQTAICRWLEEELHAERRALALELQRPRGSMGSVTGRTSHVAPRL